MLRRTLLSSVVVALICAGAAPPPATPLPVSAPEKEGFSSARLERMHAAMSKLVEEGQRSGASVLIARNGRIVDWRAWGRREVEAQLPMEKDTICRIYSMSKVITSVAALTLYEEGRFELEDAVEKYIPELKGMRVFEGGTAEDPYLAATKTPITIKQLFTHTSGLTYGWERTEAGKMWQKAEIWKAPTLREFVAKVAGLPLIAQPGEKYNYSVSIDVLGYLVEVLSGTPLDKFVEQRITGPLAMRDTSFFLTAEKKGRSARVYQIKDGKLAMADDPKYQFPSGGGGMWSTIGDYARFGQMLLNGGQLEGTRILGRKTVELMEANHLNHMQNPAISPDGGVGFGLGGGVRIDLAKGNALGTVGQFGWDGAASTFFRIDPKERLLMILFQQHFPFDTPSIRRFSNLVYQALVD